MAPLSGVSERLAPAGAAVFLDRDGRPYAPTSLDQFELLPGAAAAVKALQQAGFPVIVVTNQPDVRIGKVARDVVDAMHRRLTDEVGVDAVYACFHTEADNCLCRKPRPGMIAAAAAERRMDPARSFLVGDRWRDVSAGRAAGCRTLFIDLGYRETLPDAPDHVVGDLPQAAAVILELANKGARSGV